MTITIKSILTAEKNHPMKAKVVHLARANFRIQITEVKCQRASSQNNLTPTFLVCYFFVRRIRNVCQ